MVQRKLLRRPAAATILLIVVILPVALYCLRDNLLTFAARSYLAGGAIQKNVPGLSVNFQSLSTDLISVLRIDHLTLDYHRESGITASVKITGIRLSFSLARLRHGWAEFIRQTTVEINAPKIDCRISGSKESNARFQIPRQLPLPPVLPAITTKNGRLRLSMNGSTVAMTGIEMTNQHFLHSADTTVQINLSAANLAVGVGKSRKEFPQIQVQVNIREKSLTVPAADIAGSRVAENIYFATTAGVADFGGTLFLLNGRSDVRGTADEHQVNIAFSIDPSDPQAILTRYPLPHIQSAGEVSGSGHISYPTGMPYTAIKGQIDILATKASLLDIPVDSLRLHIIADDAAFSISRAEWISTNDTIRLSEIRLPKVDLLAGNLQSVTRNASGSFAFNTRKIEKITNLLPKSVSHFLAPFLIEDLHAEGKLSDGSLTFQTISIRSGSGFYTFDNLAIAPIYDSRSNGFPENPAITGNWKITDGDLSQANRWIDGSLFAGTINASGTLSGVYPDTETTITLTGTSLRTGDLIFDTISANALYNKNDGLTGSITGKARSLAWQQQELDDFQINAQLGNNLLAVDIAGRYQDEFAINISGDTPRPLAADSMPISIRTLAISRDTDETGIHLVKPCGLGIQDSRLTFDDCTLTTGFSRSHLTGFLSSEKCDFTALFDIAGEDPLLARYLQNDSVIFAEAQAALTIKGALAKPLLAVDGTIFNIARKEFPSTISVAFGLAYDDNLLTVEELTLHSKEQQIAAMAGQFPLHFQNSRLVLEKSPLILKGTMDLTDPQPVVALFPDILADSGPLHVEFDIAGTWEKPRGHLLLTGRDMLPGTRIAYLSEHPVDLLLEGELEPGKIRINRLRLRSSAAELSTDRAEIRFASLPALFQDLSEQGSSQEDVRLWLSTNAFRVAIDDCTLKNGFSMLHLQGYLGPEQSDFTARLRLAGKDPLLLRFLPKNSMTFAEAQAALTVKGSLTKPLLALNGTITNMIMGVSPIIMNGAFDLAYADSRLAIQKLTLQSMDQQLVTLTGNLPVSLENRRFVTGDAPLLLKGTLNITDPQPFLDLYPDFLTSSGPLHADFDIAGTWEKPLGHLALTISDMLPGPRISYLPEETVSLLLEVTAVSNALSLERFLLQSSLAEFTAKGTVRQFSSLPALLKNPRESNGSAEIAGTFKINDTDWLAARHDFLRRTQGTITGRFTVSGPLQQPDIRSQLHLQDGEIRTSTTLPALREIDLTADVTPAGMTIEQFQGTMGGSPFTGKGSLTWDQFPDIGMQISLNGKNLLFYRAEGIFIRGDTSLELGGRYSQPTVRGTIELTDSRITRNIDFLSSFLTSLESRPVAAINKTLAFYDAPLKDARFDLQITAVRPVQVTGNLFKGGLIPELLITGLGESPIMTGVVYVNQGNITLPAGKVLLDSGLIRFFKSSPDTPYVNFTGVSRTMGYDISIQADGPYNSPSITLSSSPPASSEDLLLLLLTGQIPASSTVSNEKSSNFSTVAVYLGKGLLNKWSEDDNDLNEQSILERLQIDIGRGITQSGEETIETRFWLADNIFNKQDTLFLTAGKDVWDDFNAGLRIVFRVK